MTESRIIIALDFPTATEAEQFLSGLDPASCRVKIGKELFTAEGPDFVRRAVALGFDVFAGSSQEIYGLSYMLGGTGGYLVGYVFAICFFFGKVGKMMQKFNENNA